MRSQLLALVLAAGPVGVWPASTGTPRDHHSTARPASSLSQAPDGQPAPSFKSESELVVVHATVRDGHGRHVTNLTPEAFQLFEDDRPQPISVFMRHDDPVTIGLILDVSGSMVASRNRLLYAASQFAHGGHPDDEVFALLVGDRTRAVLPPEAPFTGDPAVLHEAIARTLTPGGRTALHDAIREGLDYLSRGSHARRALVVLSDGIDNASNTTFDDVLLRAQASNAAIYAIGLADPVHMERHTRHLKRLAGVSGGVAYFPDSHAETFDAMDAVAREIRSSYALGFAPRNVLHDGSYHRLRVVATLPGGRHLDVRTRGGYTALPRDGSP